MKSVLLLTFLVAVVAGEVFFKETFDNDWASRWVQSKSRSDYGKFVHTAGKWYGDAEADKGIQTSQDARFYSISSKIEKPFSNKDKTLVVQFSVKHEQEIDCGGGYIKISPKEADQDLFNGDSPYNIMFGPDICGSTKRVHAILHYKGTNHLIKKTINPETDQLSHVYTFVIKPDQTYSILIDHFEKEKGNLIDDWDFLPPRTIKDPSVSKPSDWEDREKIPDPEDKKPSHWDSEHEFIPEPGAKKPEDWDDEMDGEWEAPQVPNPAHRGKWRARMIDNPKYKGKWVHPEIDNPEFKADNHIYSFSSHALVAFDVWQVKSGTIFDNVIITDSLKEAKEFYSKTNGATKEGERKMKESGGKTSDDDDEDDGEEEEEHDKEDGDNDDDDGDDHDEL